MSVDARKSNNSLDQWQSGKLGTGSRVQSFPRAFPSSNDVPILLLNQPNVEKHVDVRRSKKRLCLSSLAPIGDCVSVFISNREEKCDVTLPWYQNFWIATIGDFSNDDGDGNENGKKVIDLTLHVHHAFLYISQRSLPDCDVKLPNFTRPLFGVGEQNTKAFFFFSVNLDAVLSDSTPENFANFWQIK